jgi:hypothetical protein
MPKRMRCTGLTALMEQKKSVYTVLVGKPEGKRPLGKPGRRRKDFTGNSEN